MSVYVGIDVHRKRSQVAVAGQSGEVLTNRNVPNGVEPILQVIGGLPPGTPAAFEAAYGTSWLEDYGFSPHLVHLLRCKAIASARLKNDKGRAATFAQLLRADLLPEAWIAPPPVRQPAAGWCGGPGRAAMGKASPRASQSGVQAGARLSGLRGRTAGVPGSGCGRVPQARCDQSGRGGQVEPDRQCCSPRP